jgi:hypothetical protein
MFSAGVRELYTASICDRTCFWRSSAREVSETTEGAVRAEVEIDVGLREGEAPDDVAEWEMPR